MKNQKKAGYETYVKHEPNKQEAGGALSDARPENDRKSRLNVHELGATRARSKASVGRGAYASALVEDDARKRSFHEYVVAPSRRSRRRPKQTVHPAKQSRRKETKVSQNAVRCGSGMVSPAGTRVNETPGNAK